MTGFVKIAAIIAATLTVTLAGYSSAFAASRYMQVGAVTSQPIGHYEFCLKYTAECAIKTQKTIAPRVTEFGWDVVRQVNAEVNRDITPMTDREIYGRDEVWEYPTDAGDCEDFALLKQKILVQKGFSPSDVLLTVVRKPDGEGHAVLTLRTADGDYILDNLNSDVKLWSDTNYRFLKRQASFDTGRWVRIENSDEIVVGAVNE